MLVFTLACNACLLNEVVARIEVWRHILWALNKLSDMSGVCGPGLPSKVMTTAITGDLEESRPHV